MRSLTNRLALLFAAVTLAALLVIYLYVVPPLQSSLRDQQLANLLAAARTYSPPIERAINSNDDVATLDRRVGAASEAANARVTLLGVARGTEGLELYAKSDSSRTTPPGDLQFGLALEAARLRRPLTGTEAGANGPVGQAARPILSRDAASGRRVVGSVVVFSAPQADVDGNVALVRNRLIIAGVIALVAALAAGYAIARSLTGRIARMEEAARRVAGGDFTARFATADPDEIGDLARALDDMQTQLAELDSARKQFIATASHELRTPIFSLGGYLELLQDEDLDEATRDGFLTQVRDQVDRLGRLTTDLLDLSRLEAGSLVLRRETVDLRTLLQAVGAEFAPALAQSEANLELRLAAGPVEVVCDPERVAQIVRILLDNAVVHTPPGTDVVVSGVRRGERIRVSVTDFGTGIRRAALPHIFEPFFTADDEQRAQGSGLGLAIAHELAGRMGGTLSVDSHPGRTTFTLEMAA